MSYGPASEWKLELEKLSHIELLRMRKYATAEAEARKCYFQALLAEAMAKVTEPGSAFREVADKLVALRWFLAANLPERIIATPDDELVEELRIAGREPGEAAEEVRCLLLELAKSGSPSDCPSSND